MKNDDILFDVADLYKVFSDSTRIRILYCLYLNTKLCVNEIASKLNMSQSTISHQLKILKDNNLIKKHRDGKAIIYELADAHVYNIIKQGIEHVKE